MKRRLAVLSAAIMTIASAVSASAAEGKIVDGRTLVPVRGAFEELGFDVEWNAETSTAYISDDDNFVEITKGLNYIVANDNNITPDVPQQIIDDRFYLPLRAVGESVGANVEWDGAAKTAHISYNGKECYVKCGAEEAQAAVPAASTSNMDDLLGTWKCDYVYNEFKWEYEMLINDRVKGDGYDYYKGTLKLTLKDCSIPENAEYIGGYETVEFDMAPSANFPLPNGTKVITGGTGSCLNIDKFEKEDLQLECANWYFKIDGNDIIMMSPELTGEPMYGTDGNVYRFVRVK